jgi:repressor LexA
MEPSRQELSPKQSEILQFIRMHVEQSGVVPTFREIGLSVGITSTNGVSDHIKALERKGYLERGVKGSPRSIRLAAGVGRELDQDHIVHVPVLGQISAGLPLLAEENYDGTVAVDASMLPPGGQLFALIVTGESMIDAGIHDGDTLFVRQSREVRDGAIGVVMVDGEATVKRVFREGDRLRLQPENQQMRPFYVDARSGEVQVLGVAVGVWRRIS